MMIRYRNPNVEGGNPASRRIPFEAMVVFSTSELLTLSVADQHD